MASVTRYFYSGQQVTPVLQSETSWSNTSKCLGNTSGASNAAMSNSVAGSSGTAKEIAKVRFGDIRANIHKNARIDSVKFQGHFWTRAPNGGTNGAPKIANINVAFKIGSTNYSGGNIVNPATITRKLYSRTWTHSALTPANVNRDDFGVYINPGANTTGNRGSLRIDTIRMIINYTNPTYHLGTGRSQATSNLGSVEWIEFNCRNSNGVDQKQNLDNIINVPAGVEIVSITGNNPPSKLNTGDNKWNPKIDSNKDAKIRITFRSTSIGNKIFKLTQTFTGQTASSNIDVVDESYSVTTNPNGLS